MLRAVQNTLFEDTAIRVPVSALRTAQTNRQVEEKDVFRLAASISQHGLKFPIIINEQGIVIEGHHRLAAHIFLGLPEIEAYVRKDLNESDVLEFNDMTKKWKPKDFYVQLNSWVLDYSEAGFQASEIETILGYKSGTFKKTQIDPAKSRHWDDFQFYYTKIWSPVYDGLSVKSTMGSRSIQRALWTLHKMQGIQIQRLIESIIRDQKEIVKYTKMKHVLEAVAEAYNYRLRGGENGKRIIIDSKGNAFMN